MSRFRPSLYIPRRYPSTPESEALAHDIEGRTKEMTAQQVAQSIISKHRPFWRRKGIKVSDGGSEYHDVSFSTAESHEHARASVAEMLENLNQDDVVAFQADTDATANDWQTVGDDLRTVIPEKEE